MAQASLAAGWDVISPDEGGLTDEFWDLLLSNQAVGPSVHKSQVTGASALGQNVVLRRGELLHGVDQPVRQFYVLLEVGLRPMQAEEATRSCMHGPPLCFLGIAARRHQSKS